MARASGTTAPAPRKKAKREARPTVRQARMDVLQPDRQAPLPAESASFALQYNWRQHGNSLVIHADCFEWLGSIPANSLHAIITDPPYGVKEYNFDQMEKRANGNGGIGASRPRLMDTSVRPCRGSLRSTPGNATRWSGSLSNGHARRSMRSVLAGMC